jgi:predicted dehydrogenase
MPHKQKLGLALVGLGHYATDCVAVGLAQSDAWQLNAVVTGSAEKIPLWQKKWNLHRERIFSYQDFDQIRDCKDVDAVYICLPNSMHAEFAVRAAQAGKHVIVEKPIATSVAEAEQMISACKAANVKLAVGYRLRFNRLHQQIANLGSTPAKGTMNFINAIFSIDVGPAEQWRLKKSLSGGGALIDVGIYGVQAARYITGKEPVAVAAQFGPLTDPVKFAEVEEHISWQMRFPGDIYMTGYAGYSGYLDELSIRTANATIKLDPAFSYGPLHVVRGESDQALDIPHEHHQWRQMEDLGRFFIDPAPLPDGISGEEGLRDLKIILAIYQAAESGREVLL